MTDGEIVGERAGPVFQALDKEMVRAIGLEMREKAKVQAAELPTLLDRLSNLLSLCYPPHLIAVIAGWGLRSPLGPDGVSGKTMIEGVQQHHVEFLQALALTLPAAQWGRRPAEPEEMQQAIDLTLEVTAAVSGQRLLASEGITDKQQVLVLMLQDRLRTHTQMVRNWARYSEILRILKGLFAPLDPSLRAKLGFGALDVIAVAEQTVVAIEAQVGARFVLLKDIFRAPTIRQLVEDFFARFPGVAGDPQDFLDALDPDEPLESIRARLMFHADRWLVVNSVAPVAKIAESANVSQEHARTILDRLSLSPGELVGKDLAQLFLANPVWQRPGVKTGEEYFFAIPQTVVSFLDQILKALCEESGAKVALESRRAVYLEEEAARIFEVALPGARVRPGLEWTWEEVGYETDILVQLDRALLIVEAKSAALTPQGLRGAPDRVRRHVRQLIVDPSEQSARLANIIAAAKGGDAAALAVTTGLELEPATLDTVIRISVTLDDLSILASSERELKGAGWVDTNMGLATTLSVADLACVADMLTHPAQFLDYFHERARLQKSADFIGFELDYLGLYLQTGFHLEEADGYERISIVGMSETIDLYFQNLDIGHPGKRPEPALAPLFEAILTKIEGRALEGWTTLSLDILRAVPPGRQYACVKQLEKIGAEVARRPGDTDVENVLVLLPSEPGRAVVLFYIHAEATRELRNWAIAGVVSRTLEETGLERCVFLSRSVGAWDQPFDAIGSAQADQLYASR